MEYNRIPVLFYGKRKATVPAIAYRYDQKQVLDLLDVYGLPEYFRVDFCNEGDAQTKPVIGTPAGSEVPDEYLLTGSAIRAYFVLSGPGEAVQTRFEIEMAVAGRPPASDVEPSDEQRDVIDELIAALNEGVERSEGAAAAAEESEGKAKASEEAAKASEDAAKESEENAKGSEDAAADSATEAQSYAKGGTGTRTGENTDNAKYYKEQTEQTAEAAIRDIRSEATEAIEAVDQAGTANVGAVNRAGATQTANAKAQADRAAESAQAAGTSEQNAKDSENAAKESETEAKNSEDAAKESEDNAKDSADAAALSAKQAEDAAASVISLNFTDFDTGDTYGYGLGIKDGYPALKIYTNDTEG